MSDFDMLVISCRQLWHSSTYSASPERMAEFVQTSGGRVMPRYERGLKEAIDSHLPSDQHPQDNTHLWLLGHYFWSAEVEADRVMQNVFKARLFCLIHQELQLLDKPDKWKAKTSRIIARVLGEARYLSPPDMSATRNDLYTIEQKEVFTQVSAGNYQRDARQHWEWVYSVVGEWERLALVPVCEWMNNLKDRVA